MSATTERADVTDGKMRAWVQEAQVFLWNDLDDAIRSAINGCWSMRASTIARRINEAARLVGPTPIDEAPWPLVAGGVYEAVYAAVGLRPDMPDEAEWQRLDVLVAERLGTRSTARSRFAATIAEINTERERHWISGGDEVEDSAPEDAEVRDAVGQ